MSTINWTPDQPLRADATDEQIVDRQIALANSYVIYHLQHKDEEREPEYFWACKKATRELQAATTAESEAKLVTLRLDAARLVERITGYLSVGGLFNPESMAHAKVRDLLIDCRAVLDVRTPSPEGGI